MRTLETSTAPAAGVPAGAVAAASGADREIATSPTDKTRLSCPCTRTGHPPDQLTLSFVGESRRYSRTQLEQRECHEGTPCTLENRSRAVRNSQLDRESQRTMTGSPAEEPRARPNA